MKPLRRLTGGLCSRCRCRFTRPAFDAHRGGGLCQEHQRPGRPGAADDRVESVRPGEPSRGAGLRPHFGHVPLPPYRKRGWLKLLLGAVVSLFAWLIWPW